MNQNNLGLFNKYLRSIQRCDKNFLDRFYEVIDQTEGWLWPSQVSLLYSIAAHASGKLVEIGSWKGRSATTFCLASDPKDLNIYCVDTWRGSKEHEGIDKSNLLNEFKANLQKFNLLNRVNIQQGNSTEIAKLHEDRSCDIIFIDAAHDYENVKADISAWFPKLRHGGIMIGHDYPSSPTEIFQDLKQAVDEEVEKKTDLFEHFGTYSGIWGAIKK